MESVYTIDQALIVALIRNECRKWMTGNQKVLNVSQQESFFERNRKTFEFFVYLFRFGGSPCGYGIIRPDVWAGASLLTIGIAEDYRGMGLGGEAIKLMMESCLCPIELSVLKSNRRAIGLYKKLGFKIVSQTKKQLYMRHENDTTP